MSAARSGLSNAGAPAATSTHGAGMVAKREAVGSEIQRDPTGRDVGSGRAAHSSAWSGQHTPQGKSGAAGNQSGMRAGSGRPGGGERPMQGTEKPRGGSQTTSHLKQVKNINKHTVAKSPFHDTDHNKKGIEPQKHPGEEQGENIPQPIPQESALNVEEEEMLSPLEGPQADTGEQEDREWGDTSSDSYYAPHIKRAESIIWRTSRKMPHLRNRHPLHPRPTPLL